MNERKPFVLHRDETVIEPHPDQKTLTEQTLVVFTSDNGPDTRGPYDKLPDASRARGGDERVGRRGP